MEKIKTFARDIGQTVTRYYGVLAVALLATAGFIAESTNRHFGSSEAVERKSEIFVKMGLLGLMGISLLFALHIAQQRYRIKWPLPIMGFFVLAGYYLLLPSGNINEAQPVTVTVLVVSAICYHLLVAIVPFLLPNDREGFWDYNITVFINAVQTVVFSLVLWGGLVLAVVAVERLFNIEVQDVFWEQMAITVLIVGSSLIFLLFSKEGLAGLKTQLPYPTVLRFFVQYILVPLLILYLVILYSYGIKILIEWDLPEGWVSYLILAYSFLGIFSLLLLNPLSGVDDKVWVNWFSRIFYVMLLPLLALLFVAIGVRIVDYGITENRYYVLLLSLWLLGITGYHLLGFQNGIKSIPVSLFTVGMCSLLLPFVNVFHVSFASQSHRFHQLLSENQVLSYSGKIDFDQPIRRTALGEISSIFHYLNTRNRQEVIRPFIADQQASRVDSLLSDRWASQSGFTTLFANIIEDDVAQRRKYTRLITGNTDKIYSITGYDYLIPVVHFGHSGYTREFTLENDGPVLRVGETFAKDTSGVNLPGTRPTVLSIRPALQDTLFRYDYSKSIDSIRARYADELFKTDELQVADLSTTFQLGNYQVKIHFDEIEFRLLDEEQHNAGSGDSLQVYSRAAIFIKK